VRERVKTPKQAGLDWWRALGGYDMTRLYPLDPELAPSLAQRRRALGWSQNRLALAANPTESNGELVLKAVDRVQRQIELQAKLLGDLSDQPQVNILASPEWIALRATLISVLCDFPDAQAAVIARLHPPPDSTGRAS
jgi:hypothetical protein